MVKKILFISAVMLFPLVGIAARSPRIVSIPSARVEAAAVQPVHTIAPAGVLEPFTTFEISSAVPASLVSVTVVRQGVSQDEAFRGIYLVGETSPGVQPVNAGRVLMEGKLDSNSQAVLTPSQNHSIVIGPNRKARFTVYVETASDLSAFGGQVASFVITEVKLRRTNGSKVLPVAAFDPISGTSQTLNGSMRVGAYAVANTDFGMIISLQGGFREIIRISQIEITGRDLSVRIGSQSSYCYPTGAPDRRVCPLRNPIILTPATKSVTVSSPKNSAKLTAAGIVAQGQKYGYRLPPALISETVVLEIGSLNVVRSARVIPQNIVVNISNQPMGALEMDVKNESIQISSMQFTVAVEGGAEYIGPDDITNVKLVDENGIALTGPADVAADGTLTFQNSVVIPTGTHTYRLVGKISTDVDLETTVTFSLNPKTDFNSVKGVTSGASIVSASSGVITLPTMTVKVGALTVSVSSLPISQNVVGNSKQFLFANYIFDATESGEDIYVASFPVKYTLGEGAIATNLTNCKLYDGSTALTTGSNIVNPTFSSIGGGGGGVTIEKFDASSGGSGIGGVRIEGSTIPAGGNSVVTFQFDNSESELVVVKGTAKTIGLRCDVSGGASGTYAWGLDDSASEWFTGAAGIISGQTIIEIIHGFDGQRMTAVAGGTLTFVLDSNSPAYQFVNSGATGVELARIKFSAINEDIDLRQVAFQLSQPDQNTPNDLVGRAVTLWDAETNTQIGQATFASGDSATSSIITAGAFRITRDSSRVLVVKGNIAAISAIGPLISSGDWLRVDIDGDNSGLNGTYGVGVASGITIAPIGVDTVSAGVRIVRAYPRVQYFALTSSERSIPAGTTAEKTLYKFAITATGGDVVLYKSTFEITSAGLSVGSFALEAYTDSSFSIPDVVQPWVGVSAGGGSGGLQVEGYGNYRIAAGQTRYLRLAANTADVQSGATLAVKLAGDAAAPIGSFMDTAAGIDTDQNNDFIWSPVSVSLGIPTLIDPDWTNGYLLPGPPTSFMTVETLISSN